MINVLKITADRSALRGLVSRVTLSLAHHQESNRILGFLMVSYEPVVDIMRPISSAQRFFRPWRAASGAASAACAPVQVESRLGACRARRA
jgi:hypothetical protein